MILIYSRTIICDLGHCLTEQNKVHSHLYTKKSKNGQPIVKYTVYQLCLDALIVETVNIQVTILQFRVGY